MGLGIDLTEYLHIPALLLFSEVGIQIMQKRRLQKRVGRRAEATSSHTSLPLTFQPLHSVLFVKLKLLWVVSAEMFLANI